MDKQQGWITTRIRTYFYAKIQDHVGSDKEIPNTTQFVNESVKEKLQKLEASQK